MKTTRKWETLMDDTDLVEARQIGPRTFQFIEVMDMDDACGRDNEGQPRYCAELSLVDLNALSQETIESAIQSCGWEGAAASELALAETCRSYGARAPLGDWAGNGREVVRRKARSEAHALMRDAGALADRMERPVNKIGSTASEYMRGDLTSAISRGVAEGRHDARIMAKMYGADPHAIDQLSDSRPEDWLPWFMGYMAGKSGAEKDRAGRGDKLAPEYHDGYLRGQRVRAGEAVAPSWIREAR